jgi:hypothetical protein
MHIHFFLILLLLSTFLSGCGLTSYQKEAVNEYSHAAHALGSFAADEFPQLRKSLIQLNTHDVAIRGKAKLTNLDGALDYSNITARVHAANALAHYGKVLNILVGSNHGSDMHTAAHSFAHSFASLPFAQLDEEQYEALGVLVEAAGNSYIEWRKKRAIKKIATETAPDITRICRLLRADFDRTGMRIAQSVDIAAIRAKADADFVLNTSAHSDLFENRLIATHTYRHADELSQRVAILNDEGVTAVDALVNAQNELLHVLENENVSLSDIKSSGKKVQRLIESVNTLRGD